MNKVCSLICLLWFCLPLAATDSPLVFSGPRFNSDNLIIKFHTADAAKTWQTRQQLESAGVHLGEALIEGLGIYLAHPMGEIFHSLKLLRQMPQVEFAQLDFLLSERQKKIPNDELFTDQWALADLTNSADINAQEAWHFATGGANRYGEELTVAVIDSGFDIKHEDLADNLWINPVEIADNGIDDDENGYVDDIHGWDVYGDDGQLPLGSGHGTGVASVIGAVGNNRLGLSGVNWKVQLMLIAGANIETNVVVKGYGYLLKQKQLWLESNGKKGANVVVANSSFGQDFIRCDSGDYPIWNSIYNALGELGVLSAVATTNHNSNVDEMGDVPSTCTSDYVVSVTASMDRFDLRMNAGHGPISVDLAAPGYYVRCAKSMGGYTSATGTSFATPHVAGAVALMHAAASLRFLELYQQNPGKGALILKKILLDSAAPVASFRGLTVTGGILDLHAALKAIAAY